MAVEPDLLDLCGEPKWRQRMKGPLVDYMSLLLPFFLKAPDHLQGRAETVELRPPDVHTPGGKGPAHRLPDARHYQILSWATRFMRSASAMLIGFCDMALAGV